MQQAWWALALSATLLGANGANTGRLSGFSLGVGGLSPATGRTNATQLTPISDTKSWGFAVVRKEHIFHPNATELFCAALFFTVVVFLAGWFVQKIASSDVKAETTPDKSDLEDAKPGDVTSSGNDEETASRFQPDEEPAPISQPGDQAQERFSAVELGWLLVVPVLCLLCCTNGLLYFCIAKGLVASGQAASVAVNSLIFAGTFLFAWAVCGQAKAWWLKRLGLTDAEIQDAASPNELPVAELVARYGNGRIMIADGVTRKTSHILFNIFKMCFWKCLMTGKEMTMASTMGGYLLEIGVLLLLIPIHSAAWDQAVWGLGRIRDGKYRRWNVLNANAGSGIATTITLAFWFRLLLPSLQATNVQNALLLVLWIPLGIGDAMAEIVGVLFGYTRFKVYGLGEYNDKSLEGCLAMFGSTFLVSLVLVYSHGLLNVDWVVLLLTIAIASTILETWTPRGYDNFSISTGACLCAVLLIAFGAQLERA